MKIGLVLSGGMAKGAYQVGALKAISKFIPKDEIKYISCSSVGVLNGYAYVTDKLDFAEKMWKDLCMENSRLFITQVLKSSMLQHDIDSLCSEDDFISPLFYCSLLDITNRNIVYKNIANVSHQELTKYLKASVAMPIYNRSVTIDEVSYFDGAMVDNIPVFPLKNHDFDYIICIYFDDTVYKFENTNFDNKIIKITFPPKNLVKQSLVFRRENIDKMINEGYKRTENILNIIMKNGYKDVDYIQNLIEEINISESHTIRITGDVIVTNLNKIVQKFTKRKINL